MVTSLKKSEINKNNIDTKINLRFLDFIKSQKKITEIIPNKAADKVAVLTTTQLTACEEAANDKNKIAVRYARKISFLKILFASKNMQLTLAISKTSPNKANLA